jgi:phospholipid/cholesterol/gamma-HCH transport system substrate-binding protein
MSKPFKFRYVNEIVGGFVLLILMALVAGVIFVSRAQNWFEPTYKLRVKFPPEGSWGVQKGAEVVILGTTVGNVQEMLVADDGSMEGILDIKGRFIRFIRADSLATLKKKFGVAGDAFIELTKGSGLPLRSGSALPMPAKKDTELIELLQQLLEQVRSATLPMLEQFRKAAEEYTGLAADFRKQDGHFQQLLARVEALADGLEKGQGTAGKLLKDPTTVNNVNDAIAQVNKSIAEINALLKSVDAILADVKKASGALPEMMLQTQDTVREAETLIEGIQKHWLLKKYVEQAAPSERIPPSTVALPEEKKP